MELEIRIKNWSKYNSKSFQYRYPHWFRLSKDLLNSETLFELTCEEKWVWIGLLCLACEKKTEPIRGTSRWLGHRIGAPVKVIESSIKKLTTAGAMTVNCHSTANELPPTAVSLVSTLQNITEQNNTNTVSVAVETTAPAVLAASPLVSFFESLTDRTNALYPDPLFLSREKAKMEIWLSANARKAPKSKPGWTRFIMGWLERGWEQHRRQVASQKPKEKSWEDILEERENAQGSVQRAND